MKKIDKSLEFGGRKLTLSTGFLAEQADAAVLASYGETVVLATVVAAPLREYPGYFPLSVEYMERLYAGGRIKGSRWVKREGRPSDEEILIGRLVDRSIRPLFDKSYQKEVQVIVTVLSVDLENSPDVLASIAASAAIEISAIPWNGPVGTLKVGMKDLVYFTNPTDTELGHSEMELVISATNEAIVMLEASSKEVPEEEILGAIEYGQSEAKKIITLIKEFAKEVGVKKEVIVKEKPDQDLYKKVKEVVDKEISTLVRKLASHQENRLTYEEYKKSLYDSFPDTDPQVIAGIFDDLVSQNLREMILSGKRPDGRRHDEIRKIEIEVGILPRTHGSAIFKRGQTQVLTVTTLGSPSLEQLIESAEGEETKRYIHHYSMPPFSTGETGKVGFPSRREIGHGALAEKALIPVIPPEEKFPYTIRVVSEILSSNGSTSMASACGSTLSLMDAGVPIKAAVAGIAMGLVIEDEKNFVILSDITGLEDSGGDMDFKIAGTKAGVTAMQLDVKTLKLTSKILAEALKKAYKGRLEILSEMEKVISQPRLKISDYAPKIKVIKISTDKIGDLIGPGGRIIRKIISETGAQVDVEDDGTVTVSGLSEDKVSEAIRRVEGLTKEVKVGEIYEGVVKRIQPFGAFVEFLPGKEGLIHISDMSEGFVKDPAHVVSIGQKVQVRVKEIDDFGRVNLSMLLEDKRKVFKKETRFIPKGKSKWNKKSSGPHFPTSRLLETKKKY